jgi:hypothetical protein
MPKIIIAIKYQMPTNPITAYSIQYQPLEKAIFTLSKKSASFSLSTLAEGLMICKKEIETLFGFKEMKATSFHLPVPAPRPTLSP